MEELRRAILTYMVDDLTSEQLHRLEVALDYSFNDYDITKKSRDLAIYEDASLVILKNYLGSKLISGASENTIRKYRYMLMRLKDDLGVSFKDMTTGDIRQHLARWQVEKGASSSYLENMRKTYKGFFNWMETEGYIAVSPMRRINAIKTEKKQVEPFNEKELEKLFNACDNIRDRALLEFLYSTGVRASECIALNLDDIDINSGVVKVKQGKGKKDRNTYISEACSYYLELYLESRSDNEPALWVGRQGRLCVRSIQHIVERIGERAGVEGAHPHRFRHSIATDLVRRNAPITAVQTFLGHESINTTMGYVKVADEEVKNLHKKLA